MTLTLTIRNVASLDNGSPTEFVLHRRGATIGRAATCDWSLPDPHRYISSRHCEIVFRDEHYVLTDVSTNGTFLNGARDIMTEERVLASGDLVQIGHYEIVTSLSGSALAAHDAANQPPPVQSWTGWDSHAPSASPPAQANSGWDDAPVPSNYSPPSSGWDATSPAPNKSKWGAPPTVAPAPAPSGWDSSHRAPIPSASTWEAAAIAPDPASDWSSAAPDRPPAPSTEDVWGRISEGNVVDWARGGFGQPATALSDPLGLQPASTASHLPAVAPMAPASPAAKRAPTSSPLPMPTSPPTGAPGIAQPAGGVDVVLRDFLAAAGLVGTPIKASGSETLVKAGLLLRRLVAGLVVLVEARARAKAQMGTESTRLEFNGNNPIKFARAPEQALAQLLSPSERGFMEAEQAIEDSFFDLQSHQMATLKAMQGALKATLERFSPAAIRTRTEQKGVLSKVLPAARDAALWQNYEREFGGVAQGSDEAFMDVFAKEFRKAYDEQSRR